MLRIFEVAGATSEVAPHKIETSGLPVRCDDRGLWHWKRAIDGRHRVTSATEGSVVSSLLPTGQNTCNKVPGHTGEEDGVRYAALSCS